MATSPGLARLDQRAVAGRGRAGLRRLLWAAGEPPPVMSCCERPPRRYVCLSLRQLSCTWDLDAKSHSRFMHRAKGRMPPEARVLMCFVSCVVSRESCFAAFVEAVDILPARSFLPEGLELALMDRPVCARWRLEAMGAAHTYYGGI